jgi:hypothetical protein
LRVVYAKSNNDSFSTATSGSEYDDEGKRLTKTE